MKWTFLRVALLLVAIQAFSGLLGHLYGACVKECKEMTCRELLNPVDPNWPCRKYDPYNGSLNTWALQPTGGNLVVEDANYDYYVCSSCTRECLATQLPSHGTCYGCLYQTTYSGREGCTGNDNP